MELVKLNPQQAEPAKRGRGRPRKNATAVAKPAAAAKKTAKAVAISKSVSPSRAFMCCVTLVFLVISITHLADGVGLLTECPAWQDWAIAIGIDLMLCADEWMMIACEMPKDARIAAEAMCGLIVLWSSYLNALAFSRGHIDLDHLTPIGMGVSIPIVVALSAYAMSRSK
jgi:hypothetical protein